MRGGSSRTWKSLVAVARQLAQVEERRPRRRDDDARGARLQLGHALLADRRARPADALASRAVDVAACGAVEREERVVLPFCSSVIVSAVNRAFGASAVTSSVPVWPTTRSGLSMVSVGGAPRPAATYSAPTGQGEQRPEEREEPAEHGLHHTSLVKSEVPDGEWRYRLGVRTRGSQPRDRGSIPRTATRSHTFPLITAPRRIAPGLFSVPLRAVNRPAGVFRHVPSFLISFAAAGGFLSLTALPALAQGLTAQAPSLVSSDGRRLVTAVEAKTALELDGALDEEVWRTAQVATGFVQAEPHEGQPATEPTEVRIAFDDDALYIGVVCLDAIARAASSSTTSGRTSSPGEQDSFEVILDTFADRRNGFVFVDQRRPARSRTRRSPTKGATSTPSWDARVDGRDAAWTRTAGRPRSGFRSRRCASSAAPATSGASTSAAASAARTRSTTGRPCRASTTCTAPASAGTLDRAARTPSQGHNLRVKPWVAADTTRAARRADASTATRTAGST